MAISKQTIMRKCPALSLRRSSLHRRLQLAFMLHFFAHLCIGNACSNKQLRRAFLHSRNAICIPDAKCNLHCFASIHKRCKTGKPSQNVTAAVQRKNRLATAHGLRPVDYQRVLCSLQCRALDQSDLFLPTGLSR